MRFVLMLIAFCGWYISGRAEDVPRNIANPKLSGDSPTLNVVPQAAEGDWPWWRGPTRDGKSADRTAVTKWSPTENVVWVTKVPGRGHSSPIVCGKRVFLT